MSMAGLGASPGRRTAASRVTQAAQLGKLATEFRIQSLLGGPVPGPVGVRRSDSGGTSDSESLALELARRPSAESESYRYL